MCEQSSQQNEVEEKADVDERGTESLAPQFFPSSDTDEPTTHELESRTSAYAWEKIQSDMLTVITEGAAMPPEQACIYCDSLASFRCQQCGPLGFFCSQCLDSSHKLVNLFHVPEKWEVMWFYVYTNVCDCCHKIKLPDAM